MVRGPRFSPFLVKFVDKSTRPPPSSFNEVLDWCKYSSKYKTNNNFHSTSYRADKTMEFLAASRSKSYRETTSATSTIEMTISKGRASVTVISHVLLSEINRYNLIPQNKYRDTYLKVHTLPHATNATSIKR